MRRVNDLSGDCCLWGINAQEESILGVKLVRWKIQEEKVLGGKNSGERWGPAEILNLNFLNKNASNPIQTEKYFV